MILGNSVKKGELLAEIETDKATMELESYKDCTLLHIGADKGGKLQVNDLLAIIGQQGEDINALVSGNKGNAAAQPEAPKEAPQPAKAEEAKPAPQPTPAPGETIDISKIEEVVLMPRL